MTATASWIEVAWSLMALIGLIATALGVRIAATDARQIRSLTTTELTRAGIDPASRPLLRSIARDLLRYEALLLYLEVVFLAAGVRMMLLPPNPAATDGGTTLIDVAFLLGAGFIPLVSIQNRLSRRWRDRRSRQEETHAE